MELCYNNNKFIFTNCQDNVIIAVSMYTVLKNNGTKITQKQYAETLGISQVTLVAKNKLLK